jgi:hypothetical protein
MRTHNQGSEIEEPGGIDTSSPPAENSMKGADVDANVKPLVVARAIGFSDSAKLDHTPHSATRFVLPFKLALAQRAGEEVRPLAGDDAPKVSYRKATASDWIWANQQAREGYLTLETITVLFERASWWVMDCNAVPGKMIAPDGHELNFLMRPPAVVLFEDPKDDDQSDKELLQRGFIIVEVAFKGDVEEVKSEKKTIMTLRLDELLLFNELFRYWREPFKGHKTSDGEMSKSHSEKHEKQLRGFVEPFQKMTQCSVRGFYEERWLSLLKVPLGDGRGLLVENTADAKAVFGDYADDRAFVWTRALVPETDMKEIIPHVWETTLSGKKEWKPTIDPKTGFREMFGYWLKLVNTDQPDMEWKNSLSAFERKWAHKRTYRRWEHCNCYYGFHTFSAAMLSKPNDELPTWQHWFQMYFDQVLLLLYVRVTIFRFSNQLTTISKGMLTGDPSKKSDRFIVQWRRDFRELRRAFTCFENLYQFPLLSNQQQGVEMYELARKSMDIDELYEEVSKEVMGSDELLEAQVEEQRSEYAYILNYIAVAGLGLSVALSSYQIGGFQEWWRGICTFWLHLLHLRPEVVGLSPSQISPIAWAGIWIFLFWAIVTLREQSRKHPMRPSTRSHKTS